MLTVIVSTMVTWFRRYQALKRPSSSETWRNGLVDTIRPHFGGILRWGYEYFYSELLRRENLRLCYKIYTADSVKLVVALLGEQGVDLRSDSGIMQRIYSDVSVSSVAWGAWMCLWKMKWLYTQTTRSYVTMKHSQIISTMTWDSADMMDSCLMKCKTLATPPEGNAKDIAEKVGQETMIYWRH
jgi:hypothetical protein